MPIPRMNRAQNLLIPLCLALGAALCSCASSGAAAEDSVEWNIHHMRFARALELAEAGVREHPGDKQAEALLARAQLAALLEKGRRLTLDDEDVEALKVFEQALQLDPTAPELIDWIQKTELKLGDRWLQVALELHARGELPGALDAYEQSLRYHPGYEVALKGMEQAVKEVNHRELLSRQYFDGGVHALSDYWLERANALFAYSNKYKPGQEHTLDRTKQVNLLLAKQRQRVAQAFEKGGLFGAARSEYRMALALAPDDPPSKAALERCTKEVQAQRKLEDAHYQIMRGNFERAEKLIEDGLALTTAQTELFEGARVKMQEQKYDIVYQAALALERDQRFPEAIEKYRELLAQASFFKDALARVDTLEGYVALAGDLYAKAAQTADDAARLDLLQQIRIFWPEYRDVARQVSELEHKLSP
jgi:tetratricopeptide (TPR) repeat protein